MPSRLVSRMVLCWLLALAVGLLVGGNVSPSAHAGEPGAEQSALAGDAGTSLDQAASDCRQLADMLQQQRSLISRETGQIKREIAALRDDLAKPGIREIFAGIGYIFGLAGIGLYVHSRKDRGRS